MMIFSSKTEIRAYTLESQLYYSVAKNMKQVVGVDYDGHHIYWTDIFLEHESIVRSIEDGSEKEVMKNVQQEIRRGNNGDSGFQ